MTETLGRDAGTAVAVVNDRSLAAREQVAGLIRPVAPPSEVIAAQNETRELIAKALASGRDYGVIPGTDKPTLLKPGAERISSAMGCYPRYKVVEQEVEHDREVAWLKRQKKWANKFRGDRTFTWIEQGGASRGLYRYVVECELVHRATGVVLGQKIGSCSSMESKYVDRPRDSENTVLQMAQKRAFVGAVLNTFGLSDQFTQDLEDLVEPEVVTEPAPPAPEPDDAASADQMELLEKLIKSHVISEPERKKVQALIKKGLSKARAKEAIDHALKTIADRKAAEREPGDDDDVPDVA